MAKDKNKKNAPAKTQSKQPKKHDAKAKNPKKGGPVAEGNQNIFGKLFEYLSGVRAELKRVTWPSREKVIYLVGVVVVTLIFFAVFTAAVDWASSEGIVNLNTLVRGEEATLSNEMPVQIDFGDSDLGQTDTGIVEDVPETE